MMETFFFFCENVSRTRIAATILLYMRISETMIIFKENEQLSYINLLTCKELPLSEQFFLTIHLFSIDSTPCTTVQTSLSLLGYQSSV